MMELELDFYNTLQPPDSLSLQEMIECDIRTRAYDECTMTESTLANPTHLDFDGLTSPLSEERLGALDTRLDSELLRDANNLTWFTTCHASPNGNLDFDSAAGVLVNPQTGLPITYPLDTSFDTCQLDSLTDDLSSEEKEETVLRPKTFNSVNPTMLEHLDANVLKEKLAKANGQSNGHRVFSGEREIRKNSFNGLVVRRPLRRDLSEDSTSSSSSSSSSEEEEIDDVEDFFNVEDDDEDDEDYQEREKTFVMTVTNSNKSMKRKCPVVPKPKVNGRAPATNGEDLEPSEKVFPKPAYSYSCLIAMALKNSQTGSLPVSEIYGFMTENYPYFKTAPNGWKNSVRHNLSLNKCFEKIEKPGNGNQRKGCLWTMNPEKIGKMDEEVAKWQRKDPTAIRQSMAKPEHFELLEKGYLKLHPPTPPVVTANEKPKNKENLDKSSQKIKMELTSEPVQDSNDSHLDNSLLDINFQNGLWGELDEKMDFDIPLASDVCEDTTESATAAGTNGHAAGVTNIFNGTFLSKQLRVISGTALK